jgi:hypothetical protein
MLFSGMNRDIFNLKELEALHDPEGSVALHELQRTLRNLRERKAHLSSASKIVHGFGIIIFLASVFVYFVVYPRIAILLAGGFYLIVSIAFPILSESTNLDTEIEAVESEITLRGTGADATEQRAEQLFKSHSIDLRRYYQQTLRHSTVVFMAGLACITVGICIIIYVFYKIQNMQTYDDKLLTVIVGLISGILTNFIAVIYLKMFAETMNALTIFHKKLVATNHMHFANYLSSKIVDDNKRDDHYANIAAIILNPEVEKIK